MRHKVKRFTYVPLKITKLILFKQFLKFLNRSILKQVSGRKFQIYWYSNNNDNHYCNNNNNNNDNNSNNNTNNIELI